MSREPTESQLLWEAHDRIAAGWVQGMASQTHGPTRIAYCATGAITASLCEYSLRLRAANELGKTLVEWGKLRPRTGDYWSAVQTWNDQRVRTQEEVLELFAKTAIRLEEQGR